MLTTLAALKANYLNIDVLDTERDAAITECIKEAGAIIKVTCHQPIEQETVDFFFSGIEGNQPLAKTLLGGNGYESKALPYTVPVALAGLYHRTLPTDSWVADSGAVIYTSDLQSSIYNPGFFSYRFYKATLQVGYTVIPDDLVFAASELALFIYNETNVSNEARAGLASKTITQNNIATTRTYLDTLSRLRPVLTKYMIHHV